MQEKILTPDDVADWMQCERRTAIKLMRSVSNHWCVTVKNGKRWRYEPRVLESEILKKLRNQRNTPFHSPLPVPQKRVMTFSRCKTAKEMLDEHLKKQRKEKNAV
ncbi:MAG: hypothetical protein JXR73_06835 [Candidatus Omnitrophica bacterium]|nr:hypothetical protein [Candidatus Omnitrophota bacterium]